MAGITNWLEIDDVVMPTPTGVKYSYSVFDSDNSKRSETGVLHREVIRKNVHSPTFTFKLQTADYRKLMTAIEPDVIKVKYLDPKSETGYMTIDEAYAQATLTPELMLQAATVDDMWWSLSVTFIQY